MATKDDLKNMVYEAQEKLFEAIENLEAYVRETGDRNAEAYIVDHLKIIASSGHGFLSRDITLDDLIRRIDGNEEDEEE